MSGDSRDRGFVARSLTLVAVALAVAAGVQWLGPALHAQVTRPGGLIRHDNGQSVSPVYEGWYPLPDGTIAAAFGYFNRNYEEEVRIPVGPNNRVQPGPQDRGQPTYFFPRRHIGFFVIKLSAGTSTDTTWTLSSRGETLEIPVNLAPEYLIEPLKAAAGPSPGNMPPVLRFDPLDEGGTGPVGAIVERTATVGTPLALDVWVTDDGLGSQEDEPELTVRWRRFRAPGAVTFSQESPVVEAGKASTTASFADPGQYVLYVRASDGSRESSQCCWTNGYVQVNVGAADSRR